MSPSKSVCVVESFNRNLALEKEKQAAVNRGLIQDVHTVFAELINQSSLSEVEDSTLTEYRLFKVDRN